MTRIERAFRNAVHAVCNGDDYDMAIATIDLLASALRRYKTSEETWWLEVQEVDLASFVCASYWFCVHYHSGQGVRRVPPAMRTRLHIQAWCV